MGYRLLYFFGMKDNVNDLNNLAWKTQDANFIFSVLECVVSFKLLHGFGDVCLFPLEGRKKGERNRILEKNQWCMYFLIDVFWI